jgi:hypothetical protein
MKRAQNLISRELCIQKSYREGQYHLLGRKKSHIRRVANPTLTYALRHGCYRLKYSDTSANEWPC